jgi:hypothetical protein
VHLKMLERLGTTIAPLLFAFEAKDEESGRK